MKSKPTKEDSDHDGILDSDGTGEIIDTAPMTKGLENGIVGNLKIFAITKAGNNDFSPIINANGHAFLSYTSYVNDNLDVGGLIIIDFDNGTFEENSSYSISSNDYLTLGTFGNYPPNNIQKRLWINIEKDYYTYTDTYSLSKNISLEQIDLLEIYSEKYDNWKYLQNCSYFATKVWNNVVGDNLGINAYNEIFSNVYTPNGLVENIKEREDYRYNDTLKEDLYS